jgi:hypothetical protein
MVLAGVGFLTVAATVILAVIIIGINKGDRSHLINAPRSTSDAFTRSLLVGIRYPACSPESAGEETGAGE